MPKRFAPPVVGITGALRVGVPATNYGYGFKVYDRPLIVRTAARTLKPGFKPGSFPLDVRILNRYNRH